MTPDQSVDSTSSATLTHSRQARDLQALILRAHACHGRFKVFDISSNTLTVVLVPFDKVGQTVPHVSGELRVDPATDQRPSTAFYTAHDLHLRQCLFVPLRERLSQGLQVAVRPGQKNTTHANLVL